MKNVFLAKNVPRRSVRSAKNACNLKRVSTKHVITLLTCQARHETMSCGPPMGLIGGHMSTDHIVREAVGSLREGMARDDVYHAIVRYAAQNKLDRYELWRQVQEGM